jgi:hypothetical protein
MNEGGGYGYFDNLYYIMCLFCNFVEVWENPGYKIKSNVANAWS